MADTDVLSPDFNPLQVQPAQPAFNATQQDTQNSASIPPAGPIVSRNLSSSSIPASQPQVNAPTVGMSPLQLGLRGALMGIAAGMAQRTAGQGAAAGAESGAQIDQQEYQRQEQAKRDQEAQQEANDRHTLTLANLQSHNMQMMQAQLQVKNGTLDYYSKLGQSTQAAMNASQDADGFQVYGTNMPEAVAQQKFLELHQQNPQSRVTYGTDGSTTDAQGNVVPTFTLYDPGTGQITLTPQKIQSLKSSGIDVPSNIPANAQISPTYLNQLRSQSVQKMAMDTAKASRDTAVANATTAQVKANYAPQEAQADLQGKQTLNKEGNARIGLIQAQAQEARAKAAQVQQALDAGKLSDKEIVAGMLDGTVDITKTASIRGNERERLIGLAKQADPTWNMQTYQNRLKTSQAFTPDGKMGQQVISLNTFTGHVGDASDLVNTLRNSNSPLINKPMNDVAKVMGNDKIAPFQTALEAAKKEYLTFLNAGHVESKTDQELSDKLVDVNQTPAQIQATLKQMAKTVLIRANSINGSYKAVMNKDYPNMLNDESIKVLNTLGFGSTASRFNGGAAQPQQTQQPQTATPQTHVFSLSSWQKANPNGDANAAKAQATAQGFQVVQ